MLIGGTTPAQFSWNITTGKLRINTSKLSVTFQDGAIAFLGNHEVSEIVTDTDVSINYWETTWNYIGFGAKYDGPPSGYPSRVPIRANGVFSQNGAVGTLTYSPLQVAGTSLVYRFTIEPDGDISFIAIATEIGANHYIDHISIPIMNYEGSGYITGPTRIAREDDNLAFTDNYGYDLPVAVIEGNNCCIGIWNENQLFQRANIRIDHNKDTYDHIYLWSYAEPLEDFATNRLVQTSGPWRITTQDNWLAVVKAWRARFETLYPAVEYLWNNACDWVQNIHCIYSRGVDPDTKWDTIATLFPAKTNKILWFPYVNLSGTCCVWGDNDWLWNNCRPNDSDIAKWIAEGYEFKAYGYTQTMLNLYTEETYETDRMPTRVPEGWSVDEIGYDMPTGVMNQAQWENYWADKVAPYGANYFQHHPASDEAYNYIIYNYPDWCVKNHFLGGYWDIMGVDKDSTFNTAGIRFFNGKSYLQGARDVVAAVYSSYPVMSEVFVLGHLPYHWYTWRGYSSMISSDWVVGNPNHPFLTALVGSYQWTFDYRPLSTYDFTYGALLGGLPEFFLEGEYQSNYLDLYFQARAQLFVDYELFNDLPITWATGILAYYRSNTDNKFRFEKRATDRYAFVEEDSPEITRLQSELIRSATCPDTGLAVVFTDTYTAIPTLTAEILTPTAGDHYHISGLDETGATITCHDVSHAAVERTINWIVFGENIPFFLPENNFFLGV